MTFGSLFAVTPRLTPEQIRELRDLHSAGTPGEWVVGEPWSGFSRIEQRGGRVVCHTAPPEAANRKRLAVDHQLIVKARNALPALLDEIESLRGEVERLRRGFCGKHEVDPDWDECPCCAVEERDARLESAIVVENAARVLLNLRASEVASNSDAFGLAWGALADALAATKEKP